MKQFYEFVIPPGGDARIRMSFVRPVRKCTIWATSQARMALKFSDGTFSEELRFQANHEIPLDFQSANNGGGVSELYFMPASSLYYVYVTVSEYGTGGDIDWYKK